MINSEEDRQDLLEEMPDMLRSNLPKLTESNQALHPFHIVFTRMVSDIKENYSLTFFVK